jgi:hypothetical protein
MSGKKLIGMGIALVVLVAVARLQNAGHKKHTPKTNNDATLFQGLELNAVDGIELFQGSESAKLEKKEGKWVVKSLYDYPVDFSKLADALRAASDVKTGSPVRSSNVDAAEYGFNDAKTIVLKSGGKEAAKIEVGALREASESAGWANQHFIRKDGSDAIYLVDYDFRPFATESDQWIEPELLNIPSSDIVAVKVGDIELNAVSNTWTLADLNKDTEELQPSEANRLRNALQYLNCASVADPSVELTNTVVYTASTTNKTITVTIGNETDHGRLMRFDGDVPETIKPWTYVVSSYKADSFLISRDQLVKNKEVAEKPID